MSTLKKPSIRLSLEALESRWVPAGNVLAYETFFPDTYYSGLSVEGDAADNQIRIVHDTRDHVRIEGLNGTTVNGLDVYEISTFGEFVEINIQMAQGSDSLQYEFTGGQSIYSPVRIDAGHGPDDVNVVVRGWVNVLSINTDLGDDRVTLDLEDGCRLSTLQVDTGQGDDYLLMNGSTGIDLPWIIGSGTSWIETSQGDDVVQFSGRFANVGYSPLFIELGAGDDTLIGDSQFILPYGDLVCSGGSGHDTVLNADYFSIYFLLSFELIED